MSLINDLKRAFKRFGEVEIQRDERCPAPGLAASIQLDSITIPVGIGDISISGIHLVTDKQLTIGNIVPLTLRKQGEPEDTEPQFSTQIRVIDKRDDGFGLAFVVPPGMKSELWAALMQTVVQLSEQDDVAHAFNTLRTIAFICGLSQSDAEETIALLLDGQLDSNRTATLVKVADAAEKLLATEPDAKRMRAHPKLLAHILREASWATEELNIQLWAGLFASSCSVDAPDESNHVFANLLVHLTPTEARIFIRACERALASTPGTESGTDGPVSVIFSPKEMIEATGVYDLYRNATDLAYLFNLGLVQKVFDFTSYRDADSFDVTPSVLGIELYKRCHGYRGAVDLQHVQSANAHLANFIPAPQPVAADKESLTPLPTYTAE
jgi:hypothetical protein